MENKGKDHLLPIPDRGHHNEEKGLYVNEAQRDNYAHLHHHAGLSTS